MHNGKYVKKFLIRVTYVLIFTFLSSNGHSLDDDLNKENSRTVSHLFNASYKPLLSSIGAVATERTIFCPVDTIIIHRQQKSTSISSIARDLYKTEGVKGFFKGYQIQVSSAILLAISLFATNEMADHLFDDSKYKNLKVSFWSEYAM